MMSATRRLERLEPAIRPIRMVLDTDTYNEIDDQFALVYALLSPEKLTVAAVYAAPFKNDRAETPGEGMQQSYEEILRLYDRLSMDDLSPALHGSTRYFDGQQPERSPAVEDLIKRALASPDADPLYVVAIGAITNIANAILLQPAIIEKIVVVWLGGHALHWPHNNEFNLMQDVPAARLLLDCGVPFVHLPCQNVVSHLTTTKAEIDTYVRGQGPIGDYLADIFSAYTDDHFGWSKEIWDIAAIAYLLHNNWVHTTLVHSPILTDQLTWSVDSSRHFIRSAFYIDRDAIFRDLFTKLAQFAQHHGGASQFS
jgi:inosine-uridine nucleoside N-ribohydrolase